MKNRSCIAVRILTPLFYILWDSFRYNRLLLRGNCLSDDDDGVTFEISTNEENFPIYPLRIAVDKPVLTQRGCPECRLYSSIKK